jgi:RNA polymerase sigma-70 factor (ECF subfamily)
VTVVTQPAIATAHGETAAAARGDSDLEALFLVEYRRVTRVIARVTRDPGRAEELAVEVFLKWSRTPSARGPHAAAWLHRVAVRAGLNELRGEARRSWYERLFAWPAAASSGRPRTPEEVHTVSEEQRHARSVLRALPWRSAALLLLRSEGLSYAELAAALNVNPASVGTLLARAQRAFRQEFEGRYGDA